jgi:predicted anti-sigma-YlaC factor YlaD
MVCVQGEQVTALMSLALDGLLDADGQRLMEQHLAACPACRAEWASMRQVATLFEQSPMAGPPLGFAVRVERRLEERAQKRRWTPRGIAMLTGSLSLAGLTVATVAMIVIGVVAWQWLGAQPAVYQGSTALTQVVSGVGLVGKGASLFLKDLLVRYGLPLLFLAAGGLALTTGAWAWLFVKRPGNSQHNGYV